MTDAQPAHQKAVTKAPINWNHLNADDRAKLEKMMAPTAPSKRPGPRASDGARRRGWVNDCCRRQSGRGHGGVTSQNRLRRVV
jgi:hypothetical protein